MNSQIMLKNIMSIKINQKVYGSNMLQFGDFIIIYSGNNGKERIDDVILVDTITNKFKKISHTNYCGLELKRDIVGGFVYQNKMVYSMGGNGVHWYNDIYVLNIKNQMHEIKNINNVMGEWFNVPVQSEMKPLGRAGHICILHDNKIIVGYGWSEKGTLDDMWEFDLKKLEWNEIKINSRTKPRASDSMSCVLVGDFIYVFGGGIKDERLNEVWKYDILNKMWISIIKNEPIFGIAGAKSIHYQDHIYIIGGSVTRSEHNNKLIKYSIKMDNFVCTESPIIFGYMPQCIIKNGILYTHGGCINNTWNTHMELYRIDYTIEQYQNWNKLIKILERDSYVDCLIVTFE